MYDDKHVTVIIAAAGSGSRMGSDIPKQLLKIKGKPMLIKTTEAFEKNASVDDIIIVADKENLDSYRELFNKNTNKRADACSKLRGFVIGGETRQESVQNGLEELPEHTDIVLIHDGARPFVTDKCIESVLETVSQKGAAIAAVPVIDTIKTCKDGTLISSLERENLYAVQTPQGFLKEIIIEAHRNAVKDGYKGTDDAVLVERAGYDVFPAEGDFGNIKITVPENLLGLQSGIGATTTETEPEAVVDSAESIMSATYSTNPLAWPRAGIGFDAHRFERGRRLVLAGVEIDWESGLLGHSDADVVIHALIDAILGAAALGDIGALFPDTDSRYTGISSVILLETVAKLLKEYGFVLVNTDITVIAERPKLRPYIDEMRSVIGRTLGMDVSTVGIKATTTEGMGFCGREEGIAALAVVQLVKTE